MLQVITQNQPTMTSREIASLVNSNHSDVKRSAERLSSAGLLTQPLAEFPFKHNGNDYIEYRFNKRDSLVLVARLSPEFTASVIDRWQELEAQQPSLTLPDFSDPVAAARAWADAVEQKQSAEKLLAIAAPKAEFVDRYVSATGNVGFRQMAKLLKAKEPELRAFLLGQRIMYRLNGSLTPYQNHIDAGRFELKAGVADHGDSNHAYTQSKLTPKGVEWLAGEWAKAQISKELQS